MASGKRAAMRAVVNGIVDSGEACVLVLTADPKFGGMELRGTLLLPASQAPEFLRRINDSDAGRYSLEDAHTVAATVRHYVSPDPHYPPAGVRWPLTVEELEPRG